MTLRFHPKEFLAGVTVMSLSLIISFFIDPAATWVWAVGFGGGCIASLFNPLDLNS